MEHICGMLIAGVSKISKLAFRSVIRTTFTVKNKGNKDLEIDTISLIGTDVSEFSIQNDNCSHYSIVPSRTCTLDIIFTPTSEGTKRVNLSIISNDPHTPILTMPLFASAILVVGDITGDGVVDLGDVVLALQICAGIVSPSTIHKEVDVKRRW